MEVKKQHKKGDNKSFIAILYKKKSLILKIKTILLA